MRYDFYFFLFPKMIDSRMCLNQTSIASNLNLNKSSTVQAARRFTASMCIQYCRGMIKNSQYQYAVLTETNCTCASKFDSIQTTDLLDTNLCGLSSGYSMIGNDSTNGKDQLIFISHFCFKCFYNECQ